MVSKDFDLAKLNTFPKLLDYLRDELDWPIEDHNMDDLTFEYAPEELGIIEKHQININSIQQLRPLNNNQPWGIFFIDFESKRLPIVLLRRLLSALVPKNRSSSRSSSQPTWNLDDLLFVSLLGEEKNRQVCFSHFKETEEGLPVLQTFSWDETETHLYYLKKFNLESLRWPGDINNSDDWKSNWSSAFTVSHNQVIKNSKELSVELAKIAKSIRYTVDEIYKYESEKGHYHNLLAMFKEALIHDLKPNDFSDMIAQTVTYGLFSARATGEKLTGLSNLSDLIPNTNPFLRELFNDLTAKSDNKQKVNFDELGLNELLDILNATNTDAIIQQFGRQTGGGSEDPVIHFYEDFLKKYDKQEKVEKGVFYTPKPVVSFIVRSVHEMIIDEYNLEDGLADTSTWVEAVKKNPGLKKPPNAKLTDPFVQILDPAVGTGTFLVEVIDLIYHTMISKWKNAGRTKKEIGNKWNDYVNMHLIPRIYGFELMMAPYSICHMKIGLKLKETGFEINNVENRFNIFLTNSLEEPQGLETALFKPFLAVESDDANRVKLNVPITVIIGNPPYSISTSNKGPWIKKLIEVYKKDLNEKKINIDDDYIKFIRYGEYLIERNGIGILAYISNNSFIDGITHREMRKHLLTTFDKINIFDLHGSVKKKEYNPEGGKDENVFPIQQGVSINLFSKSIRSNSKIFNDNLYGLQQTKYNYLFKNNVKLVKWKKLKPIKPYWFFVQKDFSQIENYHKGISITQIFPVHNNGIKTDRDKLFIDFTIEEIKPRIEILLSGNYSKEFSNNYRVEDSSSYKITKKIKDLSFNTGFLNKIQYRPLDIRFTYYDPLLISRPAKKVMPSILNGSVALLSCRQQSSFDFQHVFVTNLLCDICTLSSQTKETTSVFPLYLFQINSNQKEIHWQSNKTPNINVKIKNQLDKKLKLKTLEPIEIFDYIYGVLHSSIYRNSFKELLKIDFPRIPFTANNDIFQNIISLGRDLREIHLLESQKVKQFITKYPKDGDNTIIKPEYMEDKVYINKDQYFDGVPELVWNFYIGGYQPAQKWLKDRKGRKLSAEDIEHYQKIIVALTETDRIMKEIDKIYPEVEKDLIEFKLDEFEKDEVKKDKLDPNQKIFDLIKKGEGLKNEFKATFQKSIEKQNIPPHVIEHETIDTIAAFCNTKGGTLLIGVKDNGEIYGIENDNFPSKDKFINHLRNKISSKLGDTIFDLLDFDFFEIKEKTILLISCKPIDPKDDPVFVNKNNVDQFYVRRLDSTVPLNSKEQYHYNKKRFK